MKNTSIIVKIATASAFLALALTLALGAFPAQADAYYSPSPTLVYQYPSLPYFPQQPAYQPAPQIVYQTPVYQPIYQQPQYYPVYPALSASCYASQSSVPAGSSVQWTANASGGTGGYTYSWNGTDMYTTSGQTAYVTYYSAGTKTASVTVYSGSQTATVYCSNSVSVYSTYNYAYPQYYTQPTYIQQTPIYYGGSNNAGLDVGCYADPATARVNQPVTWNVEVAGGLAPYAYSWTGTDGLSGSQSSIIKYYGTIGEKSAIVTVTSADGRTATRACSGTVKVQSSYVAPTYKAPVKKAPAPVVQPQTNSNSAAALFSIDNIPWGWVAILVILVLFLTVLYLIFNRPKI